MAVTYDVYIEPAVHEARKELPGSVRQRIRDEIEALARSPRPHASRALKTKGLDLPAAVQFRRIRLDRWRIVYAVNDAQHWVWVLGVFRRPPYNYEDLADLAKRLPRP